MLWKKHQKYCRTKISSGAITLPPGVSYKFAGNYEHQLRATKRLAIVIPISLMLILLLLYFQFQTVTASFIHFSGVFVAFAGGFHHAVAVWTGMVYEFLSSRNKPAGYVPDAPDKPECGGLGRIHCPVRNCHERRGYYGYIHSPGI